LREHAPNDIGRASFKQWRDISAIFESITDLAAQEDATDADVY
jgi:hypothetical protein